VTVWYPQPTINTWPFELVQEVFNPHQVWQCLLKKKRQPLSRQKMFLLKNQLSNALTVTSVTEVVGYWVDWVLVRVDNSSKYLCYSWYQNPCFQTLTVPSRLQFHGSVLPWVPIKAYRPCPNFIENGGRYQRSGQGLDEIAFGRDSTFKKNS